MTPPSTSRSQLLLIDTCVIIEAHCLDVWEAIIHQCSVLLPETVVGEAIREAREFDDIDLRLEKEIEEGLVRSPSLPASSLKVVRERCRPFPGEIHSGELECLAFLLGDEDKTSLICSSDAVVFRYLGWIQWGDRGISLEEILRGFGHGYPLRDKLTKSFRERWTRKGFEEAFQRGFIKP